MGLGRPLPILHVTNDCSQTTLHVDAMGLYDVDGGVISGEVENLNTLKEAIKDAKLPDGPLHYEDVKAVIENHFPQRVIDRLKTPSRGCSIS